jgi:hypothetical protein
VTCPIEQEEMAVLDQRTVNIFRLAAAPLLIIGAMLLASNRVRSAAIIELPLSLCAPESNTFSTDVTNPFFPLPAGQQWVLVGKEGPDDLGLQVTVLNRAETFFKGKNSISTVRVEEKEWEDDDGDGVIDQGEFVIETSINYFAQTQDGTVCYFGETVDIFQPDGSVTHEGSWRADDPGHAPGIFMPADPQEGMTYQQEVAPGIAEDEATILAVGRTVSTPAGTFTDTLRVRDFNPLDGSRGVKSYARNVGVIHDGPLLLSSF